MKRRSRYLAIMIGTLATLVAVLILLMGHRRWVASQVEAELELVRQSGNPLTAAELEEQYYSDLPKSEDATPYWEEACRLMPANWPKACWDKPA